MEELAREARALRSMAQTLVNAVRAMLPYMPCTVAESARLSIEEVEHQSSRVAYLAKQTKPEPRPEPETPRAIVRVVTERRYRTPVLD